MRSYRELHDGRFAVLADFEDPVHMELFHIESASGRAQFARDQRRGRAETGGRCLRLVADGPGDTLVMNNDHARGWYLKRDWRPYDLLILNVAAKPIGRTAAAPQLFLELAIEGAPSKQRTSARTSIAIQPGWNNLRLDLADLGEAVPLDDARELRFSVRGTDSPVELLLDDIVLTAFREPVVGDPQSSSESLYVLRVGRRLRIGSTGRFELTFARGQIVAWYDLASDPLFTRNLVSGATLGPSPAASAQLASAESDPDDEAFRSGSVHATTEVIEVSPVRAVISCRWRLSDESDIGLGRPALLDWKYVVYPSGQVYVSVECSGSSNPWCHAGVPLAFTLTGATGAVHVGEPSAEGSEAVGDRLNYATLGDPTGPSLLVVPFVSGEPKPMTIERDSSLGQVSLHASAWVNNRAMEWRSHIWLGSAIENGPTTQRLRAEQYFKPPHHGIEIGELASPSAGLSSQNGFDHVSGCFHLEPDERRVRVVVDGRQSPHFSPAFTIQNSAGHRAWVYVDDRLLEAVARDEDGNVIFQVPGVVTGRTTVEVLLEATEASARASADGR
jgi:hypothetical protein